MPRAETCQDAFPPKSLVLGHLCPTEGLKSCSALLGPPNGDILWHKTSFCQHCATCALHWHPRRLDHCGECYLPRLHPDMDHRCGTDRRRRLDRSLVGILGAITEATFKIELTGGEEIWERLGVRPVQVSTVERDITVAESIRPVRCSSATRTFRLSSTARQTQAS